MNARERERVKEKERKEKEMGECEEGRAERRKERKRMEEIGFCVCVYACERQAQSVLITATVGGG